MSKIDSILTTPAVILTAFDCSCDFDGAPAKEQICSVRILRHMEHHTCYENSIDKYIGTLVSFWTRRTTVIEGKTGILIYMCILAN